MFRKLLTACIVLSAALPLAAQTGAKNGEWRSYAAEPGSTKYSPLDQINRDNVKNLRIAWRFKTDNLGPRPDYNMQSTPIVVNGVMYVQAGTRRTVVALDPVSGEMLWMWRMDEGKRGASAPRQGSGRGLAYWTDGKGDERIVTVTPGYHLAQLNAKTGVPVATFGKNGIVDLKTEIDQPGIDLETADIGLNSPPALGNNVIVVGAAHLPGGAPRAKENVKGYIRGYDVRTGKRLWIFHTIPQPGEFGNDTWEKDSWSYTGNAGNWGPITIDEELNRVYLATEDGTGDYFGGHRPGNNLFSASRRLPRSHHREAAVVFPGDPSRHLGLGLPDRANPDGHHGQRQTDQSRCGSVEAGISLHVRSRLRPAGVADRRTARAARQSAHRVVFADAAISDQAGCLRQARHP